MRVLLIFLISTVQAYGFTLLSLAPPKYNKPNEIKVNVTSDGCSNAGVSAQRLLDLAMLAVEEYWNSVETANIEFIEGEITNFTGAGQSFDSLLNDARTLGDGNVLVGCSTNISATAAAVGGSGGNNQIAYGAVVMKNSAVNFNRGEEISIAILAHEMGHVLGLGHSRNEIALMDSSGGAIGLNKLTQDDRNGATFLYPYESDPGSCWSSLGTIEDVDGPGGSPMNFLFSLLLGLLGVIALKAKKFKLRSF